MGIEPIDTQHKKLFVLVNKLKDLEDKNAKKEEIQDILYYFRDYAMVHFEEEEDFMLFTEYLERQEHKKIMNI